MIYYIYKIENKINHKKYIGLTNNISRRRIRHFTDLKCQRHSNSFLQKEYDIYGKDNFDFSIVYQGEISSEEISKKEVEYIEKYDSYYNGYNQNKGGNFGPSNGGTHLIKADIFNICAALEFCSRPGTILGKIFNVSNTTISRIKHKENHVETIEEYEKLSLDERRDIYDIFIKSSNFYEDKVKTTVIKSKRKLTEQQVHLILANREFSIVSMEKLCRNFNLLSSNTIYTILRNQSYKDYRLSYENLTFEQKEQLVSLLRN